MPNQSRKTIYEKTEWAELRGYRPCKWCSRMDGRFQIEKEAVGEYLANSGLVMDRKDHMLYIRSDIGCWKVVFSKKFNDFVLYHRNHADGIVPLAEVEKDSYHKQSDHFQVKPHTTKVACFLLPPCGGCPLGASDCNSSDTG